MRFLHFSGADPETKSTAIDFVAPKHTPRETAHLTEKITLHSWRTIKESTFHSQGPRVHEGIVDNLQGARCAPLARGARRPKS